jgi:sugar phosphate permease
MFIVEAAPAVLLGLACLLVLQDGPAEAGWLAAEQRDWLADRLRAEQARQRPIGQLTLWQVLGNRHVLLLAVVLAGTTANSSGIQLWQPQIIKAFGLTNMQTGLLNSVPFALASVLMIWWGRRSDRTGERVFHTAAPLALTALSFLVAPFVVHSLAGTLVILCLGVIGIYAAKGPAWAISTEWLSAGTAAAGLAQINALSNLAGFGTTYLLGYIRDKSGTFSLALMPLVALALAATLVILLVGRAENRRAATRRTDPATP